MTDIKSDTTEPEVITMGCRLNGYESGVITDNLKESGLKDVIVVNTCAVTSEAVRQARQTIRKLHRQSPDKKIIVTGCAAQTEPETFADMQEVSKVVGNHEKLLPKTYHNLFDLSDSEKIKVNDIMSVRETAGHMMSAFNDRARAYLQIQNGCDHRCTFCIIPYGRGNSRSVPVGIIIDQIKRAIDQGIFEVVLTGIDITSWGGDLPASPRLGYLVEKILTLVPDLPRLRLSSIDSIETDSALWDVMCSDKRFMPHLHLSLQAGDNMILKRMKRRHSREQALDFCVELRKKRPEIAYGADIIAGFPTETEEMFKNTVSFLSEANITYAHIFPFSPRKGTPAAKMPQVEKVTIKERAKTLREVGQKNLESFSQNLIGTEQTVIIEPKNIARAENFAKLYFETDAPIGSLHKVRVKTIQQGELVAEKI